jgi:ribonucleoside-diphosphate reductase alpha chain
MRVFDTATDVIKQGGKRRGANMGILSVDHPDILEFIYAKSEEGVLTNFNISVAVPDSFMEAVKEGGEYEIINPRDGSVAMKMNARYIFDMIAYNAWRSGDPGIIFIDRINKHNPTPHLGKIESTNPCGEQPLLPYESCNLGSINLSLMVKRTEDGSYEVDWKKLREVVRISTYFLDNVIDANSFPLPQIENMTLKTRKIGLGVMGWAELLFKLGIPYDSDEAVDLARKIMEYITYHSKIASIDLAKERGVCQAFRGSIYNGKNARLPFEADDEVKHYTLDWSNVRKRIRMYGIRNATTTTIAPTGTISIIAGASSGIEPLFALSFIRNVMGKTRLFEVDEVFEEKARELGIYSEELIRKIAQVGTLRDIPEAPKELRRIFVTALEIDPEWHTKMQAAFQEFTDNATSKTVNLSYNATPEDVRKIYLLAYNLKCKGITIYRYGSKGEQVLYIGKSAKIQSTKKEEVREELIELDSETTDGCQRESCKL